MLKVIKKGLTTPPATSEYPHEPLVMEPNYRGKPEYDASQCIACGACTNACPSNALTMKTNLEKGTLTWSFFLGRCIYCARCEEVCPTTAIRLGLEFETAVWHREDLFETADFPICKCRQCGKPWASKKEIDYAIKALGLSKAEVAARKGQFETCPDCKNQNNLIKADNIDIGRHLEGNK